MLSSLESLLANPSTQYTKSVIQAGLRTPQGEGTTWVVVEDTDDVAVYQKFFKLDAARLLTSAYELDGQERKGCSFLEKIVDEILTEEESPFIVGIRDTDYTKYEGAPHVFPPNVFHTDYRDVEMMLLSAQSVLDGLNSWNADILMKFDEGIEIARTFGYIRICNHLFSLGCNFKRKVKVSKLWNEQTHSFYSNWKQLLMDLFLANCGNNNRLDGAFSEERFNQVVESKGLEQESYLDICQGHDTLKMLQYMMVNNEYNETKIMQRMMQSYSLDDIHSTRLYRDLVDWAIERNLDVLN